MDTVPISVFARNFGPASAEDTVFTLQLPTGATAAGGSCAGSFSSLPSPTWSSAAETIGLLAQRVCVETVQVPPAPGDYVIEGAANSANAVPDPFEANNFSALELRVVERLPGRRCSDDTEGTGCPALIPDDGGASELASSLTLVDCPSVGSLRVGLLLPHTWVADLALRLRAPSGLEIPLFANLCGSTDDIEVVLDDTAANQIGEVCPPRGPVRLPDSNPNRLADFSELSGEGTWTLFVRDGASSDLGLLLDWSIDAECSDPALRIFRSGFEAGESMI